MVSQDAVMPKLRLEGAREPRSWRERIGVWLELITQPFVASGPAMAWTGSLQMLVEEELKTKKEQCKNSFWLNRHCIAYVVSRGLPFIAHCH